MSRCGSCGEFVSWFPLGNHPERFAPPMELGEMVNIVVGDGLFTVRSYVQHECDPLAVDKYQKYQRDQRKLRETMLTGEHAYRLCIDFACRKCGAQPTVKCENLSDRKNQRPEGVRKTRWPHDERMEDANVQERFEGGQ